MPKPGGDREPTDRAVRADGNCRKILMQLAWQDIGQLTDI
jgi:hypothetical protein